MAIPSAPTNVFIQQGNGNVFLSWDLMTGATSYSVQRSPDGVTFSTLASPAANNYLDSTVVVGTNYYYQIASTNASGTSAYSIPEFPSIVPTNSGDISLGQLRIMAQQRADLQTSGFVSTSEWNSNINQSYFELYDLLITLYEDYFLQTPYTFTTTGAQSYTLPTDFYKLLGVDCGLSNGSNAFASLKKFDFLNRNAYVYPQLNSTVLGIFDLRYRLMGNSIYFIPTPASGQVIKLWYIPKLTQLLKDTDILSGISGWSEYVLVDAAIKAMQKEESDVSALMMQKQALIKRIEDSAMNRDAGQPDTIADSRSRMESSGGSPWMGSFGGL